MSNLSSCFCISAASSLVTTPLKDFNRLSAFSKASLALVSAFAALAFRASPASAITAFTASIVRFYMIQIVF
jgi:hypothetical protein